LPSDLRAFHHPVAIVFEKTKALYFAWLKSSNVDISIGQDTNRIIRLLPPAASFRDETAGPLRDGDKDEVKWGM
jgi:hypothetical protein